MKIAAVIMAGGKGERFWPKSRKNCPKQFLSLTDDGKTMIQLTVERLLPLVEQTDIFISTGEGYREIAEEQLPDIPKENILVEPVPKNTAPCIGYAAEVLRKKYGDAVMLVLPSDHLIKNKTVYIKALSEAAQVAQAGENLVTIGITPSYPETGYGYIHFELEQENGGEQAAYPVKQFVEKPDLRTAKEYLASGAYLWNSGMFVWKASTILNNISLFLPDLFTGLEAIGEAFGTDRFDETLREAFGRFPSESIDYGVMEQASDIYTIPGNFGWDDVGNWLAMERINQTNEFGNMVQGDVVTIDTKNTIICGSKKLIAAVGLEDLVIVDTEDALLICEKGHTQEVKKVIENLKICNRQELL